jgi:hypothetical protein
VAENKGMSAQPTTRQAMGRVQVQLQWSDAPIPILVANQFAIQYDGEQFYLIVGQASPPIYSGSPEQVTEQLKSEQRVTVTRIAQYGLTRAQMEALHGILRDTLAAVEKLGPREAAGGKS